MSGNGVAHQVPATTPAKRAPHRAVAEVPAHRVQGKSEREGCDLRARRDR